MTTASIVMCSNKMLLQIGVESYTALNGLKALELLHEKRHKDSICRPQHAHHGWILIAK